MEVSKGLALGSNFKASAKVLALLGKQQEPCSGRVAASLAAILGCDLSLYRESQCSLPARAGDAAVVPRSRELLFPCPLLVRVRPILAGQLEKNGMLLVGG